VLQIKRNIADNPPRSTDAGSKMLRARCKRGIQRAKRFKIAHLISKPCNYLQIKISAANKAQRFKANTLSIPCKLHFAVPKACKYCTNKYK
jgi:hypothetical protein